ncbi:TPA: restriction endonuclease subunit S [Klebsiella pneumoniae]|nr:restriction endonuclease subunit S [Klebsiella pneumoniae]
MAKYKAYPEYRDSGVEWLGGIPEDWQTLRGKYVFKEVKELSTTGDETLLSVSEYYGVKPRQDTIEDGDFISRAESLVGYKKCQPNDLAMNIMLAWKTGLGVSDYEGIISPAYSVFRFNTAKALPAYMHYLLRTKIYTTHFKLLSTGVVDSRLRLYPEVFGTIEILLPRLDEQTKICAFLNHETAKIDSLIEKQQQLIELLKEKRQAVISHAVTKGLNPDVPMKDSGVEWLGDVPEHWGITKLKWVGRTTSGGTPTTSKFEIYYEDGHIPWIRTTDLNNGELFDTPIRITSKAVNDTACSILPVGSVLLGMYGGAGSIGKHAILRFESTINQAVCGVLPCGRVLPDFLHKYYEFYRPFWMVDAAGTRKDPNIGQDNIKEGIILIPPFEEQIEINNHIDNMRNIYECIIENALEGVDLLQERRTALISAAVTGKIDVRDWVAPDAQDVEASQEVIA